MAKKPSTPSDPDLFTILSRIEARLEGMDARIESHLERIEAEQTRQRNAVEKVDSTLKRLAKQFPGRSRRRAKDDERLRRLLD